VSLPVFKVRAGGCVAVGTGAKAMGIAPLQTAKNKPSRTRLGRRPRKALGDSSSIVQALAAIQEFLNRPDSNSVVGIQCS
jgi:hypothetical protein